MEKDSREKPCISKSEIGDYLYCINWYCRELSAAANNKSLPKEERTAAGAKCRELYELKRRVLIKLVAEGAATVYRKPHRIGKKDYCCVRLRRGDSFHIKEDSCIREMRKAYEQKTLFGYEELAANAK